MKSGIFVHCSASEWGSAIVIDRWHRERGFREIGYDYVITNGFRTSNQERFEWEDGLIEIGRPLNVSGAHTKGFNDDYIGICLIGDKNFTEQQFISLDWLVMDLMEHFDSFNIEDVHGHYEAGQLNLRYATQKTCPNIEMNNLREFLDQKITLYAFMESQKSYIENLKGRN